jgi:hypothetical protein
VAELHNRKYIRDEARAKLWLAGDVHTWYLKPKQATVVDFVRLTNDPFFEASRRFGKTTSILGYCLEEGNKRKITIRWCEPQKNQCREIVMTEMDLIQAKVPEALRWKWHQVDSYYENPWNGSRMYLRGVNEDKGESARGTASDIIVCDELGSWRYPEYIINEILGPQLLTTNGTFVFLGTPPRNLTHTFYAMKELAKLEGRFVQRLIHDQEIAGPEQVEKAIQRAGGWESPAVKREYLCQKITDPNFAIVPEWDEKYVEDLAPDEFFPFYLKYDSMDVGVRDLSVVLLAYYDFRRAKLVILDEIVMNGPEMTTEKLAEATRAKEAQYFGVKWEQYETEGRKRWRIIAPPNFRIKRVSDVDLRLVQDMSLLHGLYFEATDKGYLEQMVNDLRIWVGSARLAINPRCANLLDCLRFGLWDEDRKAWERSDRLGHFDALAALMYLVRNVDMRTNPIPSDYGKPAADWFVTKQQQRETTRAKFKKAFNLK